MSSIAMYVNHALKCKHDHKKSFEGLASQLKGKKIYVADKKYQGLEIHSYFCTPLLIQTDTLTLLHNLSHSP